VARLENPLEVAAPTTLLPEALVFSAAVELVVQAAGELVAQAAVEVVAQAAVAMVAHAAVKHLMVTILQTNITSKCHSLDLMEISHVFGKTNA
jgi:hypothetical protein